MDFYELIKGRESIRNYDATRLVDGAVLDRILNAGRLAPSAANQQPWRFILVSSEDKLKKVRASYNRDWFYEAPHVLVVTGDKNKAWTRTNDGYNSIETDLAIAMSYITLAAENEGVASCWIAAFDPVLLRGALNLGGNERVFGIIPLGYPKPDFKKVGNKQRKLLDEIVERV
jgi:nitroreductase